ncbi:unnamed protein product, partial [Mesorhabditis belari]|uniref:Beta-lactamase-related domain-containing protein n=1 Tax=Mesorhabditis belari TaxID=2138241 RepID=A0AAF3ENW4_9BILA
MQFMKKKDWLISALFTFTFPIFISHLYCAVFPLNVDDTVHGFVNESFLQVYDTFRENFAYGYERDGASVAVYHKSQLVVHLWGGWADREKKTPWLPSTRAAYFSATKAIASLCMALLVDKGKIEYDDLVTKHWPEYGQFGKNRTTIEDILTHKAGLPYLEEAILLEHVDDSLIWMKMFEKAKPLWEPGTASGYHPVTFGFLVDGILRKVDGRSLQIFFHEEIAQPYGLNLRIGNVLSEAHHVAKITQPSLSEYFETVVKDPRILFMLSFLFLRPFDDIIHRIQSNPSWLIMDTQTVALNDPHILKLNLPAVTGVGTADSFARLFSLAIDGTLLSNETLTHLKEPTLNSWHFERTVVWPVLKGRGFFYEPHPFIKDAYLFGHPGYGGQQIIVDLHTQTTMVYVSNGLKTGSGELCKTYMRLFKATYRSLSQKGSI